MKANYENQNNLRRVEFSELDWYSAIYNRCNILTISVSDTDYQVGQYVECFGCGKESTAIVTDIRLRGNLILLTIKML